MRRLSFLLLLLLPCIPCTAQGPDSLLRILKNHHPQDTVKLNLLNDIAFAFQFSDPAKGLSMADSAITLAQRLQRPDKEAAAWSTKGANYLAAGEDSLAARMYDKALAIHELHHNLSGAAKVLFNRGLLAFNQSDYRQALDYYQRALAGFETLHDDARVARVLNSLGVTYMYLADYPQALQYYLRALRIHEAGSDKTELANTLTNIGILYKTLHQFDKALGYHQQAFAAHQEAGNQAAMAQSLSNIGTTYDEQGNTMQALAYYQKALAINKVIGNKRRIAGDLTNIGIVYNELGRYAESLEQLQAAQVLYEQTADLNSRAIVLKAMGDVYRNAPENILRQQGVLPANRLALALQYQQQSLQLATEAGAPDRQMGAWESLYQTYTAQHQYEKALHAYQHYITLRDTLFNAGKDKDITRQEIRFEYEKKEALLKAEQEKQSVLAVAAINRQRIIRNAMVAILLLCLTAAGVIFIFYKRKRDADAEKKQAEFHARSIDTEMKVLRLQMNPHFIFNSLNSISDYMARNDIATADSYLTRFAKVIRLILEHSEQKNVPLSEDLEALELYLQLEKLRLNQRFDYQIQIGEGIDPELTLVPPFLLQPLVENSIWHGVAGKQENGRIIIRVVTHDDVLVCTVEDNGVGRQAQQTTVMHKRSWGMKITQSRLQTLNETRKPVAALQITDLHPGTRVQVTLPLELSF